MDFTKHDEKDLRQCNASELTLGAVIWLKQPDGEFHKMTVEPPPAGTKNGIEYREQLAKWSKEGRLWTRRDKAFKHFWE